MQKMNALILYLGLLAAAPSSDRNHLAIELFGGTAANFPTPLSVGLTGQPESKFTASYDTKAFKPPLYYAARIEFRNWRRGLELQFIHHKLYVANPPSEIRSLEATHGYNIVTVNGCLRGKHLDFRMGVGFVLAHIEAVVRREDAADVWTSLDEGYALTGPAFMIGAGRNIPLRGDFFIDADLQLTAARASQTFGDTFWEPPLGTASVPNIAVHLLVGIGYRPLYSPPKEDR